MFPAVPPVMDRPRSALPHSGRRVVQVAALALLTLVLTLAGQASIARGALQTLASLDGVVDRIVAGDSGILPAKPGLRAPGEADGSRIPADQDPPAFIISQPPQAPARLSSADPGRAAGVAVVPQQNRLAHQARAPPTERGFPSVETRLSSRQATPSRPMA
jgi:hypothetical protein